MEQKFEFRKKLLKVHNENVVNLDLKPNADDFIISDELVITIPENSGEVVKTAAKDFIDYLFTSMNISAIIGKNGLIDIAVAAENPSKETAFDITFDDKIHISAADERSAAQALYYLEDLMSERKAPYIKKEKISVRIPFTLRVVPSTYRDMLPPDEYLALIAHQGINTVMYHIVKFDNFYSTQYVALVKKLSKWGLDIYCCSAIPSKYHPDDPEAKDYYAKTYGEFIKRFPEVKGIILVGESIGFPSKDPNSSGVHRLKPADGIPVGKTDPGFYPCSDYYKFVNIVKDSVRPYNKDIDIVFWTYNFWSQPLEARMECINNLPTDISLMVTFELSEQYKMDGITKFCCDYTISRIGPCEVFCQEAALAKERGIRLYSQTCTAGCTWDYGTIPYMPFPQKWIKRFKAVLKANEDFGLVGMLEGWRGFFPSIISELAKKCYFNKNSDFDENIRIILRKHFGEHADIVYKAFDLWSEASDYIHSTYDNQYGPLRVGTAYPFCLLTDIKSPFASPWYDSYHRVTPSWFQSLYSIREEVDTMHWRKMAQLMKEGADLLKAIENPSEELILLENLGRYIYYCTMTVVNIQRWHKARELIHTATEKSQVEKLIAELRAVGADERQNALDSIECLRKDSRLGFDPCDGYVGGEEAVLWKIKYLDFVLSSEVGKYEIEIQL